MVKKLYDIKSRCTFLFFPYLKSRVRAPSKTENLASSKALFSSKSLHCPALKSRRIHVLLTTEVSVKQWCIFSCMCERYTVTLTHKPIVKTTNLGQRPDELRMIRLRHKKSPRGFSPHHFQDGHHRSRERDAREGSEQSWITKQDARTKPSFISEMAAGVPLMVVIPVCYSVVPENHSGVPSIHGNAATERQVYTISDVINTPR